MKTALIRTKSTIMTVLTVFILVILVFPATVLAAAGDYNTADIAVINEFINDYPEHAALLGWTAGDETDGASDPDWAGVTWSNVYSDKRIISVNVSGKSLTGSLQVSDLTALRSLNCSQTQLSSLIVSDCPALTVIYCQNSQLSSLIVTDCPVLDTLYCQNNQLGTLGTLPSSLVLLSCSQNKLSSLDLSAMNKLDFLDIGSNQFSSIDLSGCTALTELHCSRNYLSTLSTLPSSLTVLSCYQNDLNSLDLSAMNKLSVLDIGNNQFSSIDLSGCTALTELHCSRNNLSTLGTLPSGLTLLSCYLNELDSLNLSGLSNLTFLDFGGNRLTEIDLSGLSSLIEMHCPDNQLKSLDVSGLSSLTYLYCLDNELTSLGTLPSGLTELLCWGNQLSSLDVSGLNSLDLLFCSGNPIRTFSAPNGNTMTIVPTSGVVTGITNDPDPYASGNVGYDVSTGEVTLTAVPGTGRIFEKWILPEGTVFTNGTTETSNPVSFTLTGNMTAAPVFRYDLLSAPEDYTGDMLKRVLSVDGDRTYYSETTVDGYTAPAAAQSGSTIVTLPGDYLHTLTDGEHRVRVLFTDGYADAVLNVSRANGEDGSDPSPADPSDKNPQTGDSSTRLWAGIMCAAPAIVLIGFQHKKRAAKAR